MVCHLCNQLIFHSLCLAFLPLRFPLLFPFGEPGWHRNIPLALNNQADNAMRNNHDDDEDDSGFDNDGDDIPGTGFT